jgi:hypothetical protein
MVPGVMSTGIEPTAGCGSRDPETIGIADAAPTGAGMGTSPNPGDPDEPTLLCDCER